MNYLIACIVIFSYLLTPQFSSGGSELYYLGESAKPPCASGSFTVEEQTRAPARLSVAEALCDGPSWRARLILMNTGDKVISGYEVANTEAYEFKKGVKSSQGETGMRLGPGDSKEITSSGGFRNGRSYGKRTGAVRRNVFRLTRIEFADGSVWLGKTNR